jgi:hypothetical protein
MRFIGLLLALAASGLACERNPAPSEAATARASSAGDVASAAKPSGSIAESPTAVAKVAPANEAMNERSGGSDAPTAADAPAADLEERDGKPMDDVDDAVSATDRSGAATPASEQDGSEGAPAELDE